jgi:hypothetical protein
MSVVSLLADKHDIDVTLSAGNPGLTVDITLPSSVLGDPIQPDTATSPNLATVTRNSDVADDSSHPDLSTIGGPGTEYGLYERQPEPSFAGDAPPASIDEQPVATSDWTKMSLSLSAFQSGQRSAQDRAVDSADGQSAPSQAMNPLPPPKSAAQVNGEFDSPLAPPISAEGPSRGPVAPQTARSAPARPLRDLTPALPTRSPSGGPDGPDRLTDAESVSASETGSGTVDPPVPPEQPPPASRLDADALRERLRKFQNNDHHHDHSTDLGGHRR